LLELLVYLDAQIAPLDRAAQQAAEQDPQARLLLTQPGVGPITALAFVVTIGAVTRFPLSHRRRRLEVRIEESWSKLWPNRWLVERGRFHRDVINREILRC
jgi:transposase